MAKLILELLQFVHSGENKDEEHDKVQNKKHLLVIRYMLFYKEPSTCIVPEVPHS